MNFAIEIRVFYPGKFEPEKKAEKWQGEYQESIGPDSAGNVSMEKGMYNPLTPAPHALKPGDFMEDALRHPSILQRVENEIE